MERRAFLISDEGYYRLKIKQNEMGWTIFPLKKTVKKVIRKQMHSLAYFLSEGFSYKINRLVQISWSFLQSPK